MRGPTTKARLDADKKAKPKTRLIRKHPAGACVGPQHGATHIEEEDGRRTAFAVSGIDPRTLVANAVDLYRKCHEMQRGNPKTYYIETPVGTLIHRSVVLDVLELLGLDVQR